MISTAGRKNPTAAEVRKTGSREIAFIVPSAR